jgi:molybdate transport system substrate-binding protein
MRLRLLSTLFVLTVAASGAIGASELGTLATMAVQGALDPLVQEFQQQTGHTVKLSYDTGPNLGRRVAADESADVIIAPAAVIDQAMKDGRLLADSVATVGRIGVGVAVRRGGWIPNIGSAEALKQALLDADAVYYSQGTSGLYVGSLFEKLGVAEQIKAKTTQVANGGVVLERVIADRRTAIGFTMISEIKLMEPRGARLAGPLPAAVQNYTTYSAAVMSASKDPAAARAFVTFVTRPVAKSRFAVTGWL